MVGKKEQRQAAMAAARAKHGAPLMSRVATKPSPTAASQRPQTLKSSMDEQRHDNHGDSQNNQSNNGERVQPTGLSRTRALRKERPKPKPKEHSTADSAGFFGNGDKRQKKIIYRKFSEAAHNTLDIVVEDVPRPSNEKEVVIKISASTASHSDCMIRRGVCFEIINPTDLPATPGMDLVGNIIAIGGRVKRFKIGDRVAALCRTGGNARYVVLREEDLVQVPRSCDSAEAVCMVSTYMTAYQSLRMVTRDNFSLDGKRVLVTGGIEPVGQALIQLCFRAGAEEIFATAPTHRHRYIKTVLGAHPLPIDPTSWLDDVRGSMDIVFDGTCYDSLESPSASLKPNGTLVCLGMSALLNRETTGLFGAPIAAYWAKLKGQLMSNSKSYEVWDSFLENKDAYKLDLEILFHLLKKRFIKPHIAKRIALSEVADAHNSLEKETARGEIVCLPWKRLTK